MKKNGFTLMELLAVIIILGFILVIAVPAIGKIIDKAKEDAYNETIKNVEKVAKDYLAQNVGYLNQLQKEGDLVDITLDEMVQANFLESNITNPITEELFDLKGYGVQVKYENNKLTYHFTIMHYKEGLILDYRFDDFQEPTVNMINNGNFDNGLTGWVKNQNTTLNVIDFTNQKAVEVISDQNTSTPGIISGEWITVTAQTEYTLSIIGQCDSSNAFLYVLGNQTSNLIWTGPKLTPTLATLTVTFNTLNNTAIKVGILFSSVNVGDKFGATNFQLEKKAYATPFVNGSREGIIKDYSLTNNYANLSLETTPRWVNEGIGGGSYEFDGVNNLILVPEMNLDLAEVSLGAWIKLNKLPTEIPASYASIFDSIPDKYVLYLQKSTNQLRFKITTTNGVAYPAIEGSSLIKDQWLFITATYDGNNGRIYLNGKLMDTKARTGNIVGAQLAAIGNEPGSSYFFNGFIDNILIYERALSETEILHNYNAGISKLNP